MSPPVKITSSRPDWILDNRYPQKDEKQSELFSYVSKLLEDVRKGGDIAVRELTEKFDKVTLQSFQVTKNEVYEAYSQVTQDQVDALKTSIDRISNLEKRRLEGLEFNTYSDGVVIQSRTRPIYSCGCYVPGGRASYPSTLLMNVIPARVAGVKRIVVTTPPDNNGKVNPLTLVASDLCNVDEVYKIGGVQAIASLAYGTESVQPVNKIVGPGNQYVAEAKKIVSREVAIDSPAGPSEVLIVADESADPYLIALDMISQAEHGPGGISGLVTTSQSVAEEVKSILESLLQSIPRVDMVSVVLEENGFIYICNSIEEAIDFANEFGAEHLEIMTDNPEKIAGEMQSAGLILLGPYTPVASTDYCMGVNHVLPTEGYGKINSGLTVLDFLKIVNIVECSKEGLNKVQDQIRILANAEGLPNHGLAVEGRFKK